MFKGVWLPQAKSAPEVLALSNNDDRLAEKSGFHLRSKSSGMKNLSYTESPSTKIPSLAKQLTEERGVPFVGRRRQSLIFQVGIHTMSTFTTDCIDCLEASIHEE